MSLQSDMKPVGQVKSILLVTVLVIVLKLTVASAIWVYLRQYVPLIASLWVAKLLLVPLFGFVAMRYWPRLKAGKQTILEIENDDKHTAKIK